MLYGITVVGARSWPIRLVLPEALLFLAAGAWLSCGSPLPGSGPVRDLSRRLAGAAAGRPSRWALLLLPVLALAVEVLGARYWLGQHWWTEEWTALSAVVLVAGGIVLISPRAERGGRYAAVTGLQILGLYGIILGAAWTSAMDPASSSAW